MENIKLAIIGLGYVGLPLAVEFGKKIPTIGFDINSSRVKELTEGIDKTLEITEKEIGEASYLSFTTNHTELESANIYIVTVPTPIDEFNKPDLEPLFQASEQIGKLIKRNDIVIYESTVYPGATEEQCIPILERESKLSFNKDFFVGYSPERINPGDKHHKVSDIVKVTSGSTPEIAKKVDSLYRLIITAGTYPASSIKVAEAAKVIENTQRDVNIALMNELSKIFNILEIETEEVLKAAGSKWNFLKFSPGLVGGHCIGVDPYYLTYKAQEMGYDPEVILSGRRINDGMGTYVANRLIKLMIKKQLFLEEPRVLIMGLTFKENCPDVRNTKVIDIIKELSDYGCKVDVYDPWVDRSEALTSMGLEVLEDIEKGVYSAIIVSVAHTAFQEISSKQIRSYGLKNSILYDLKSLFPSNESDLRS
jgi:UDP-N-acetyl-D-galactosamine dehydrogenase